MRRFLLLFSLFATLLSASDSTQDLVSLYRAKGMAPIEERLDRTLASEAYWREALQKHEVVYGYFDHETDLLLTSKKEKTLKLFHANESFYLKQEAPIVVGRVPGDKVKEGDMRTPIGVYRFVNKLEHPGDEYGPLAFVTDYPNRFDRIWRKEGHGIWLHGFPLDCPDKNATKGCIAVDNRALEALNDKLDWHNALLIISDDVLPKIRRGTMAKLLAFLFDWRYDWKYNRLESYLRHYAKTMIFRQSQNFHDFQRYKQRIFENSRDRHKTIRFENLQIVPYPNAFKKRLWYVSFAEYYKSGDYIFHGPKRLLIEETPKGAFQIVIE